MDTTTAFVLIIATLVVGVIIGVFTTRRRNKTLPVRADQQAVELSRQQQTLSFANLLLYLGENTDVHNLFRKAVEWLVSQGEGDIALIYAYNPASHELCDPVISGGQIKNLPDTVRMGIGIIGEVASNRRSQYVDAISREGRFATPGAGMEAAHVMPMVSGVTLLGVMITETKRPQGYTDEQLGVLEKYASVVALQALAVRRMADSQHAIARFGNFQDLARTLVEQLDTPKLIQSVVAAAREMLDTQMSILFEVRADDERLHPLTWSGIDDDTARLLDSRFKEDLKGLVAWAKKPARTADLRIDQRTARASQAVVAGMISELAAPVLYLDKLYGVLAVETDVYREFHDEEVNLLMALAAQAGIAMRNAQLFGELQSTNGQLRDALENLRASQEEIARAHAAEIKAYESEMSAARQIQISLLPQEAPPMPQVSLLARNIPASHVSGDFYQYFMLNDGKLGVAVGDVSGKGMPAALMMAVTSTALRDEIAYSHTAAEIMSGLNKRLIGRATQQMHMNSAMVMVIFDPQLCTVEIANGGMIQPYIRLADALTWETVQAGGYPLGSSDRATYKSQTHAVSGGATLLFISDGVVESQSEDGELYGFERFEKLLNGFTSQTTPQDMIDAIIKAVFAHTGREEAQDDVTVVVFQVAK